MLKDKLVTIAIPAYKSKYLKESVASALNQTYSNIEVVIVNDNSPFPIKETVSSFNDKRIRYYENRTNIGSKDPSLNWDKCLSYAQGEFFCILCDDDIYETHFIEKMLELAYRYPNINVFRSRAKVVDRNGLTIRYYPSSPEKEDVYNYMLDYFSNYRVQTISEFFHRTENIRSNGGFVHLPLAWGADYLSIFKFSLNGGIASCNEILTTFRASGDNITNDKSKNTCDKIIANNLFLQECLPIIETCQHFDKQCFNRLAKNKVSEANVHEIATGRMKEMFRIFLTPKMYSLSRKELIKGVLGNFYYLITNFIKMKI